ncbi:MAG: type I restriction endonuclease subunit R [Bacilli bacterium]|jgi:type I restriction enzyme R subunit|nr:type I restriction endonuclease subunit R [Bacilli bacterium]
MENDCQSEAELESELIKALVANTYEYTAIKNYDQMIANFRHQIDRLNGIAMSDKEFDRLMNSMLGRSRFESAKNLRQDQEIEFDSDGKKHSVKIFDRNDWCKNFFQLANQISIQGKHENRYDVTILVNGLPLVQIELKRRGMDIKKAFNQICRYQRESYSGLFFYIQLFVISNGANTRYYANNTDINKDFVFVWQDINNNPVNNIMEFAAERLVPCALAKTISEYMILDNANKTLIAMRPYQVRAVEALVNLATTTKNNAYIWHTTGSGKTITSFKVAQILRTMPNIKKVVFLIDRKDLNTQTAGEFDKYEKDCFADTPTGRDLIPAFHDSSTNLVMTTIQKMANACKKYPTAFEAYKDSTVFIIDECHRSNFGEMHKNIKKVFAGGQFFGFTGTPIFEVNKANLDFTTAAVFGSCKDKYLIGDAIRDKAVLGFNVSYYETIHSPAIDRPLEPNEVREWITNPDRIETVSKEILATFGKITFNERYNALFAIKDIDLLLDYYKELRKLDNDKHRICACFTFEANDELKSGATESQRDALDSIIKDYNAMFGTGFSTDNGGTSLYYIDVQKRMKSREIDLLLVVDMFLTGFNSKRLSGLYLDKSTQYHRLIQAFSRTNRLDGDAKPHGNIVCFMSTIQIVGKNKPQRLLGTYKDDTDNAIKLYANKETKDIVLIKPLKEQIASFLANKQMLEAIAPTPQSVDMLKTKSEKFGFLNLFRELVKTAKTMNTFVDFEWNEQELKMSYQTFEDYLSKYKDLADSLKKPNPDQPHEEIPTEFYLELVKNDRIDFEYIMNLIKDVAHVEKGENRLAEIEKILKILQSSNSETLKYKKELLTEFLREVVPNLDKEADIDAEYDRFVELKKDIDIKNESNELNIAYDALSNLIKEYAIYEYVPDSSIESMISLLAIQKKRQKLVKHIPNFKIKGQMIEEIKNYIQEVCHKFY